MPYPWQGITHSWEVVWGPFKMGNHFSLPCIALYISRQGLSSENPFMGWVQLYYWLYFFFFTEMFFMHTWKQFDGCEPPVHESGAKLMKEKKNARGKAHSGHSLIFQICFYFHATCDKKCVNVLGSLSSPWGYGTVIVWVELFRQGAQWMQLAFGETFC